ncbi:MAG: DUF4136 domain-containing protein [Terriglobales bacterium]
MKALRTLCWVTAIVFCSTVILAEIHTDYDHNVDFSKYHTYTWLRVHSDNPLWQERIQQDVDNALQRLGLQKVPSGGDLEVLAVGAVRNEQEYQTFYDGLGPGWYWGGFGTTAITTPVTYRVGTLVVDLYDSKTKQLVWRGTATDTLSEDPSKNQNKLKDAVDDMINKNKFPKPLGSLSS